MTVTSWFATLLTGFLGAITGALIGAVATTRATAAALAGQRKLGEAALLRSRRLSLEAARYELDLNRRVLDGDLGVGKATVAVTTAAVERSIDAWPHLCDDEVSKVMAAYHGLLRYNTVAAFNNSNPQPSGGTNVMPEELALQAIANVAPAMRAVDACMARLEADERRLDSKN